MTVQRDLQCQNCDGREVWRIETMREKGIHLIENNIDKEGPYR